MNELPPFIKDTFLEQFSLNWLYTRLYENDWFYLDYWSVVHCWAAFLLFLFLIRLNIKYRWIAFLFLLFLYECFEMVLRFLRINIFNAEVYTDTTTDLVVGAVGGLLALWVYSGKNRYPPKELKKREPFILTVLTLSFVFSGFYNYSCNIDALESGVRMPIIFVHWGALVLSLLLLFNFMAKRNSTIISILYLYLIYFSVYVVIHLFWKNYFEYWEPFIPPFYGFELSKNFRIHYIDTIVPGSVVCIYYIFWLYFQYIYQLNIKKERKVLFLLRTINN